MNNEPAASTIAGFCSCGRLEKLMDSQVRDIQERNKRVELDKAWETSLTRRAIIAGLTYVVAVTWLFIIENDQPFLNALVPFGGYLFSTWSLPFVKRWWVRKYSNDV